MDHTAGQPLRLLGGGGVFLVSGKPLAALHAATWTAMAVFTVLLNLGEATCVHLPGNKLQALDPQWYDPEFLLGPQSCTVSKQ